MKISVEVKGRVGHQEWGRERVEGGRGEIEELRKISMEG